MANDERGRFALAADGESIPKRRGGNDELRDKLADQRTVEEGERFIAQVDAMLLEFAGTIPATLDAIDSIEVKIGEVLEKIEELYGLTPKARPDDYETQVDALWKQEEKLKVERSAEERKLELSVPGVPFKTFSEILRNSNKKSGGRKLLDVMYKMGLRGSLYTNQEEGEEAYVDLFKLTYSGKRPGFIARLRGSRNHEFAIEEVESEK